jgi:oligoendopeptidase F
MTNTTEFSSSAAGVQWDLADLYFGVDDARLSADLDEALKRAQAFETTYRGQINIPGGPKPNQLLAALKELESILEQLDRPAVYASLVHAAKTDDPRHGALLAKTREARSATNKHLIFFDLEWVQLDDASARNVLESPALVRYRHYLEHKRAWRPHYLSEPEEKILEEKSVTGRAAFVRLFDETLATMTFPFEHAGKTEPLALQQISARLYDADRGIRKAAAEGATRGLEENARLLTFIFNNLVHDHRSDCDLRKFQDPMASRHLANEIGHDVVAALMSAVEAHQATVQRYYQLKAQLLRIDELCDYDRYAPLFPDQPACAWEDAKRIVAESYRQFSPQTGEIVNEFFARHWIDAELRPGKRSGAFSSSAVPSVHPYILMNYTDKVRDVMTLAHELGHGVHQYLSRPAGYLQCDTPLTTAETASVFGEMLTFQRLLEIYTEPRTRLAMLCGKIEDSFATAFRQIVLTRFEQSLHQARRERGEQTTEQINDLWLAANRLMFGDSVKLTAGYGWWWAYIGHFIHVPFYCYAYAFGELLVLALFQKYKNERTAFVPKYLEMLAAGGSEAPPVLLAKLGIDIGDPRFWNLGLQLLDDMVTEAESLGKDFT